MWLNLLLVFVFMLPIVLGVVVAGWITTWTLVKIVGYLVGLFDCFWERRDDGSLDTLRVNKPNEIQGESKIN